MFFSCKSQQLNLPLMTHPLWKSHGSPQSVVQNYCKCQCAEALQCRGARVLVSILRTRIENRIEPAHNQQCILHGNIDHLLHSNHLFRLDAFFIYSFTLFIWCIPSHYIFVTLPLNSFMTLHIYFKNKNVRIFKYKWKWKRSTLETHLHKMTKQKG